jgi:hypothetical protein
MFARDLWHVRVNEGDRVTDERFELLSSEDWLRGENAFDAIGKRGRDML